MFEYLDQDLKKHMDSVPGGMAPKLVNSITRAVHLCEATLAYGRAEEPAPALSRVLLADIVSDVIDSERLSVGDGEVSFSEDIPAALMIRADAEQLYRVISNLVRNARQAIVTTGKQGEINVAATETDDDWIITITDTGPGLPPKAREHLFQPFQGRAAKGGSGQHSLTGRPVATAPPRQTPVAPPPLSSPTESSKRR